MVFMRLNFTLFSLLVLAIFTSQSARASDTTQCSKSLIEAPEELVLDHFLSTGELWPAKLVSAASEFDRFPEQREYSIKEKAVYSLVNSQLKTVYSMLENVKGNLKKDCPYEQKVSGLSDYEFIRTDLIGTYIISITRKRDHFYWTIGVAYRGNSQKTLEDAEIRGYTHIDTNGNLADLVEALNSTQHLFPRIETH